MSISKGEIFAFLNAHRLAVGSTVSADGSPESALIYVAPTPDLELVFYTLGSTRKCENLRRNGRISFVIGWPPEGERQLNQDTVQYEGIAQEQFDDKREIASNIYLEALPENAGMAKWPNLIFFRVRPGWIRFSSYAHPWRVEEMRFELPPEPQRKGWLPRFLR